WRRRRRRLTNCRRNEVCSLQTSEVLKTSEVFVRRHGLEPGSGELDSSPCCPAGNQVEHRGTSAPATHFRFSLHLRLPALLVLANSQGSRLLVVDDGVRLRVDGQRSASAVGDVAEMAE